MVCVSNGFSLSTSMTTAAMWQSVSCNCLPQVNTIQTVRQLMDVLNYFLISSAFPFHANYHVYVIAHTCNIYEKHHQFTCNYLLKHILSCASTSLYWICLILLGIVAEILIWASKHWFHHRYLLIHLFHILTLTIFSLFTNDSFICIYAAALSQSLAPLWRLLSWLFGSSLLLTRR